MAAYNVGVGTRQSDGVDTIGLQTCHEVFIHQTAIDHRYYLQHCSIGNAPSVDHFGLYTQSLSHLGRLATTTVH